MSERRIITYYRPRIQIPVETMFDAPGSYALYCLPIDGAQALLRICQYLTREVTFIDEIIDERVFYGPTDETLQLIRDVAGETEIGLMSGCDFSTIESLLAQVVSALDAAAACICQTAEWQQNQASRLPPLDGYVDTEQVTYLPESETQGSPVPPATDEARCELAQAHYYYTFQMFTEQILPFANETADKLTAAIVATTAFGALAGFVGIPVAILSAIVVAVIAWAIDGSIENFTNWMLGNKDEIICEIYNNLPDIPAAAAAVRAYVDDASEISFLDKKVLNTVLASVWHMTWVFQDQQDNGTWDAYLVPGQCDDCEPYPENCWPLYPCDLGDWVQSNPPNSLVCNGSYPECIGGYSYYTACEVEVPSSPFWIKIWWIPRSPSAPEATADFDVYLEPGHIHKPLYPTASKPVDVLTSDTYQVTGADLGKTVQIQVIQAAWYFDVVEYCIYDYDPDA